MRRLRQVKLLLTGLMSVLVVIGLSAAGASSANLSRSYRADDPITNGSLVSFDAVKSDYVVAANTDNGSKLTGVAVASNESLLAVDAGDREVQVATSGSADTLVSTLNGEIKLGDQVAVSPINGVGMKAAPGSRVIGVAQTSFNEESEASESRQVTDKDGNQKQIQVGYLRVAIAISTVPANGNGGEAQNGLQKFTRALTGRDVSTPRIVISLIVMAVASLALITLIYASIYSSIMSVGRNPLAKYAIFRTLGSVLGIAVLTATVAGVTIFFLLR